MKAALLARYRLAMTRLPNDADSLPVSDLLRIEEICSRFESAWKARQQPRIETYLGDAPEPLRGHVEAELRALADELRRASNTPMQFEPFVRALIDSGLLEVAEVKAILDRIPADEKTPEHLEQALLQTGKLTAFQAETIRAGRSDPLVLGNYVLLERVGHGGMGQVYKARHRRMKRVVALKVLKESAVESPEMVMRFQREVEAAARLSHPNIVTAYDADESRGVHFLVMEYVDGQDLASVIQSGGPMDVPATLDCVQQAARGLEYAHRQGVIHRDIKPSNLLLDGDGVVKILDMGLARMDETVGAVDHGLTRSGQIMGTLDYMAPEQAWDTRQADARADVYSLGCTLHYLLTGRPPYRGDTPTQKILAHREHPIPSLLSLRGAVPPAVDLVFRRMLTKNPHERYQTAQEVLSALETCQVRLNVGKEDRSSDVTDATALVVHEDLSLTGATTLARAHLDTSSEHIEQPPSVWLNRPGPRRRKEQDATARAQLARRWKIAIGLLAGMGMTLLLFGIILKLGGERSQASSPSLGSLTDPLQQAPDRRLANELLNAGAKVRVTTRNEVPNTTAKQPLARWPYSPSAGELDIEQPDHLPEGPFRIVEVEWFLLPTPELVGTLHQLPSLRKIIFHRFRGSEQIWRALSQITSLRDLDLFGTRCQDSDLVGLGQMAQLEWLQLQRTCAGDETVRLLSSMPKLRMVNLADTGLTDVGLQPLESLWTLEELHLSGTGISGAGLVHLYKLPSLRRLHLSACAQLNNEGLQNVARMLALEVLWLGNCDQLSNNSLSILSVMDRLRVLHIGGLEIDDAGCSHLMGMKTLEELKLLKTRVTTAGVARLRAALPGCNIVVE